MGDTEPNHSRSNKPRMEPIIAAQVWWGGAWVGFVAGPPPPPPQFFFSQQTCCSSTTSLGKAVGRLGWEKKGCVLPQLLYFAPGDGQWLPQKLCSVLVADSPCSFFFRDATGLLLSFYMSSCAKRIPATFPFLTSVLQAVVNPTSKDTGWKISGSTMTYPDQSGKRLPWLPLL